MNKDLRIELFTLVIILEVHNKISIYLKKLIVDFSMLQCMWNTLYFVQVHFYSLFKISISFIREISARMKPEDPKLSYS